MSLIAKEGATRRLAVLVLGFAITLALGVASSGALAGAKYRTTSSITYGSMKKPLPATRALLKSVAAKSAASVSARVSRAGTGRTLKRSAANTTTYTDSTGEDPTGPDITTITVSNDDAGLITFTISIPNRSSPMTSDAEYEAFIDSDNNAATGDKDGDDYLLDVYTDPSQGPIIVLWRWNGSSYSRVQSSAGGSYGTGVITMRISAADLGGTTTFKFIVLALAGVVVNASGFDYSNAHGDIAPNSGSYSYSFGAGTTTTTPTTPPIDGGGPPPLPRLPLSMARLQGTFSVIIRVTQNQHFGQTVGATSSKKWGFVPRCSEGPCSVTATIPGAGRKVLKGSGVIYTTTYRKTFHCSGGYASAGTVTVRLKIRSGVWIDDVWRATSWTGSMHSYTRGVAACGGAGSATSSIRGSLRG